MATTKTVPIRRVGQARRRRCARAVDPRRTGAIRAERTASAASALRVAPEFVEFVPHELFGKADAAEILFGEGELPGSQSTHFGHEADTDPAAEFTGEGVTLTSAQEILLFQRFNYARMRVAALLAGAGSRAVPGPSCASCWAGPIAWKSP